MSEEPKKVNLVTSHYPHAPAHAQKGLAAIVGVTINYEDGTAEYHKQAAQHHLHMLIGWCKLRPHVQPKRVVNLNRRHGKRRNKRRW